MKADVYVQQHAHLTQPRPKAWTEVKRAIVDEACFKERVRVSKLAYADIVQEDPKRTRQGGLGWSPDWIVAGEGGEALAYKRDLARDARERCEEKIARIEFALEKGDEATLEAMMKEAKATRNASSDFGKSPRTWGRRSSSTRSV